jgi:hypothetical protein
MSSSELVIVGEDIGQAIFNICIYGEVGRVEVIA